MTRSTIPHGVRKLTAAQALSTIRRRPTLCSLAVLSAIVLVTLPLLRTADSYQLVRGWFAASQLPDVETAGSLHALAMDAPTLDLVTPSGEWRRVNEPAHIVLRFEQDQVLGFYKTMYKGSDLSLCIAANYPEQSRELIMGTIQPAFPSLDIASESLDAGRFPEQMFEARFHFVRGQLKISDVKPIAPPNGDDAVSEVLLRLIGDYDSLTADG